MGYRVLLGIFACILLSQAVALEGSDGNMNPNDLDSLEKVGSLQNLADHTSADQQLDELDESPIQSLAADETELSQKAQTTMLGWGARRRRRRRHRHHRHRPHRHRPHRHSRRRRHRHHRHRRRAARNRGRASSTCSCTNDIHCKPFRGNWFDIHHVAAFQLAKIGREEAQVGTYSCSARPARWSGGLRIACVAGGAVRTRTGRVQQGYAKMHPRRRITYRGSKLYFRFTFGGVFVSLINGAHVAQTRGICGGKLYKAAGRRGRRRVIAQASRKGGFPCRDCYFGIGVWGAQCNCMQFMVGRSAQLFSRKFRAPVAGKPRNKGARKGGNKLFRVGSQRRSCTKTIHGAAGYRCPAILTRRNWFMRGLPHANCGDKFRVTQRGNRLTVRRIDRRGRNCHGWGMRLQFKCPRGRVIKKPVRLWKPKKVSPRQLNQARLRCKRAFFRTNIGRMVKGHRILRLAVDRFTRGCAMDKIAGFKPKRAGNKGRIVANICRTARTMVKKHDAFLCKLVKMCGLKSKKCNVKAPSDRVKYTHAFGGRGGRPVNSYCARGRYINRWHIRSGRLVDNIRGRCSDGRWLRPCGGGGGRPWSGGLNRAAIWVRTGALVDKFNHRGGNGGRRHLLNCGRGWAISGYRLRCGALVDRVQLQCKFGRVWRGMVGPRRTKQVRRVKRRFGWKVSLLSRGKRTRQMNTGWGGVSSRAVDGNTNGRYPSRSCTHTHRRRGSWWRVYLGGTFAIQRVVVWNRIDCCRTRLNNIQIKAGNRVCGNIARANRANTVNCQWRRANSVTVRHYGRADYLTLCEVQVYGARNGPKQIRAKLMKKMMRRHRHVRRRNRHRGRARSVCSCTNDIHCRPFIGNWFDIHHARAFTMAKIGREEAQMGLYSCRRPQRWSGGLKIACMKAVAVKTSSGRIKQQYVRRRLDYRGKKMQVRLTRGGAYVTLRGGAQSSQNTKGVCGGGKSYKAVGRGGRQRLNRRAVKANGRFPCNDCKLGVGVWGAQCDCKQFMLSRAAQFFSRKFAGPASKPVKKMKLRKMKNARAQAKKIKSAAAQCARAFFRTPIGKMVARHKMLRRTVGRFARGCALDKVAGFKPKKTKNRNRVAANVCRSARAMAMGKKPSKFLCRIVAKCGLKSKKCDIKKPKRTVKYTRAYGGRGGRPVNSYCPKGAFINYWRIRSGRLTDNIQGRCSNGKWLRKCGGRGGREVRTRASSQRIVVRTGALVDKFNGRGGNGGRRHVLNCGRGWVISGYRTRCGALVDRVQFRCHFGQAWRAWRVKKIPRRKITKPRRVARPGPRKGRRGRRPPKRRRSSRRRRSRRRRSRRRRSRRRRSRRRRKRRSSRRRRKRRSSRRRRRRRRRRKVRKAPRVQGDEKQMEKRGNKTRSRKRTGAGRGRPRGCKVTRAWANSHLSWCKWSSWSSWRG